MKAISLLPPEIKKKIALQKKQGKIMLSVAALALVAVLAYSALFISSLFLRADLRALIQEREAVEAEVAALEEYAALHRELVAAEELVIAAMGTVPPWTELIEKIGVTIPAGVWLSEVSAEYADQSGAITLRGWAYNHDDVAALLDQINTLEQLDDIRCRVSLETVYGAQPVVQFTVDALLKTGPVFLSPAEGGR